MREHYQKIANDQPYLLDTRVIRYPAQLTLGHREKVSRKDAILPG